MTKIKELIKLVNSNELYDAKQKLNDIAKEKLQHYKDEIIKNLDIFKKSS